MKTCVILILLVLFAGCKGMPTQGEKEARRQVQAVAGTYRPEGRKPDLPVLTSQSSLSNFLTYALLNQPQVEAAYFDWLASVERITVARSLPDPQLTFQMDIQDVVTSLMPGLMMSFPGMGKLRAAGAVARAESQAEVLRVSDPPRFRARTRSSAPTTSFTSWRRRSASTGRTSACLADLAKLARAQNEVGKVTLQDVLRAQIEQDRVETEIANLEDSRRPLLAQFKAALGLGADEPAPPVPQRFESTPLDLTSEEVLKAALARNTRSRAWRPIFGRRRPRMTLAYKDADARCQPGIDGGCEDEPDALPSIWTLCRSPYGGTNWRRKSPRRRPTNARARRDCRRNKSRWRWRWPRRTFVYREASRNLELLQNQLLPKQRQSLEIARSGYLAGQIDFFNLTDTEQTLLRFGLDEVEARTQRELSLAELSLIVQGMPPSGVEEPGAGAMPATAPARGMGAKGVGMLPGGSGASRKTK